MIRPVALITVILLAVVQSLAWAVEVRNLRSGQEGKRAYLQYDLAGKPGEKEADVTVSLEIGGERYSSDKLTLSGDFGKKVKVGLGRRIWWNLLKDMPAGFDGEISWDLEAYPTPEHLALSKTQKELAAREQSERDKKLQTQADEQRKLREEQERQQQSRLKAEQDRKAAEKIAAQKADQERLAREKAEAAARVAQAKADADRLTAQKAEADRAAKLKADQFAAQKAEEERISAERAAARKADQDRLAKLKIEQEQKSIPELKSVSVTAATQEGPLKAMKDVVLDTRSGLMWAKLGDDTTEKTDYERARGYISKMNRDKFGGYSGWRLPEREETEKLFATATNIAVTTKSKPYKVLLKYFPNLENWNYWLATIAAGNTPQMGHSAWSFDIEEGTVGLNRKIESLCILPVRNTSE